MDIDKLPYLFQPSLVIDDGRCCAYLFYDKDNIIRCKHKAVSVKNKIPVCNIHNKDY